MTGGPTSMTTEATHTCELIERHTILLPTDDLGADAAIQSTTIMAENWAKDQGMELRGISSIVAHNEAGVTFTVTVGKGDLAADPAATSWRWSARMLHWRKVLSNGDGREGRRIVAREEGRSFGNPLRTPGPVPAVPPEDFAHLQRGGIVYPADQRPPWQRRADGWDEDEVERVREEAYPDSGYYRAAQRRREQALLGTVQPEPTFFEKLKGVREEVDKANELTDDEASEIASTEIRAMRSERRQRCGNCYQLGGAHHPDCVQR